MCGVSETDASPCFGCWGCCDFAAAGRCCCDLAATGSTNLSDATNVCQTKKFAVKLKNLTYIRCKSN